MYVFRFAEHSPAPTGAYFEHLCGTYYYYYYFLQVLDCSNTSSCQSNSRPYHAGIPF